MEPNDLKSTPPDDAHLEAWLCASSALPPLPDDGFSRRVVAALPAPTRRRPTRLSVAFAGALAGMALVAWQAFASGNPLARLPALDAALVEALSPLASPAAGLAALATAGSLLLAYWRQLRRFVQL